jgi:hypothetical protein
MPALSAPERQDLSPGPSHPLGSAERAALQRTGDPASETRSALATVLDEAFVQALVTTMSAGSAVARVHGSSMAHFGEAVCNSRRELPKSCGMDDIDGELSQFALFAIWQRPRPPGRSATRARSRAPPPRWSRRSRPNSPTPVGIISTTDGRPTPSRTTPICSRTATGSRNGRSTPPPRRSSGPCHCS